MRLTKIRALGDEINENKKISPVLRTNILEKKQSNGSFIYIQYIYLNRSTYGNKGARSLHISLL